jgi:hypothetical protein
MSLLAASSQLMSFLLQLVFVFSATVFCFFLTSVFDPIVHVNVSFSRSQPHGHTPQSVRQ